RTGGHGLVGENADPHLAFALHVAGHRNAGRFDLRVSDPSALYGLQSERSEIEIDGAGSLASATSAMGLPILHTFWQQRHWVSSGLKLLFIRQQAAVRRTRSSPVG